MNCYQCDKPLEGIPGGNGNRTHDGLPWCGCPPAMKIGAIAPWFGSKRTLAPRIIHELGAHRAYWEPFCGSMAVLLAKEPSTFETVNDLHGDLINFAKVLKDEASAIDIYGRLSRLLMHEGVFHEAAERWHQRNHSPAGNVPDIDRAVDFFICSWMGRNGVAGTSSYNQGFCVRYTKNGGHAATRFLSCVDSIPAWHMRLRKVTILSRDGIDLCGRVEDADGVAIYVDPPYLVKGAKYIHDFDGLHHVQLATHLRRFKKTRVVVSYYEHPRLAELYPGWTKVSCPTTKALVNQGVRMRTSALAAIAPEVLLINGPSYTEGGAGATVAPKPAPSKPRRAARTRPVDPVNCPVNDPDCRPQVAAALVRANLVDVQLPTTQEVA